MKKLSYVATKTFKLDMNDEDVIEVVSNLMKHIT